MKQTAVEWLLDNLISEPYSEEDFEHNKECWIKAEEMEKQQIIDAIERGFDDGCFFMDSGKTEIKNGEHYYNKTFNK